MLEVDLDVRQRDVIFSMVHNIYKTRPTSSMSINTSLYFSSSNFSCIFSLTSKISTLSDHHPLLHVQLVNPNRHQVAHEVVLYYSLMSSIFILLCSKCLLAVSNFIILLNVLKITKLLSIQLVPPPTSPLL